METSWPSFIQSELALPRRVLSLEFLRQTSLELWEQDLFCPPSPTHLQMGAQQSPRLHPGKRDPDREKRPWKASKGPVLKFTSRWCQALTMCLQQVSMVSSYNGTSPASYTTSSCASAEGCRVKLGCMAFLHGSLDCTPLFRKPSWIPSD